MKNDSTTFTANRGWTVTFAGLGINLALGVLYTWSMIKAAIEKDFGWAKADLNGPYALCCLVFAFSMIIAGRCQDKIGPRATASIGGLLVTAGLILVSTTNSYAVWMIGFGVLVGMGLGFGYSSATPPALKWFPPAKTGMIAGLVVAGFGLAPVYLAPTNEYLLSHYGVMKAMLIYGIAFFIIVVGLAQLLINPPAGYVPAGVVSSNASKPALSGMMPSEVLRTPQFWILWVIYLVGAGAGLMVIGSLSGMAKKSMGTQAFIALAVMAIGNAGGRVIAGMLSDKIGRRWTLFLILAVQAVLMFLAIPITGSPTTSPFVIVLIAALIGANYGANLSLFPSFAKDLWGIKSFGMNYGLLFTAWGVGGFLLSMLQQKLTAAAHGSFTSSFQTAGGLLILGALLTFLIKPARVKSL